MEGGADGVGEVLLRRCEVIMQPPASFYPIARDRAGPNLLTMILTSKFCDHQPLNRQSDAYAREGIDLNVSTLADWVGACTATLAPLVTLIRAPGSLTCSPRSAITPVPASISSCPGTGAPSQQS